MFLLPGLFAGAYDYESMDTIPEDVCSSGSKYQKSKKGGSIQSTKIPKSSMKQGSMMRSPKTGNIMGLEEINMKIPSSVQLVDMDDISLVTEPPTDTIVKPSPLRRVLRSHKRETTPEEVVCVGLCNDIERYCRCNDHPPTRAEF